MLSKVKLRSVTEMENYYIQKIPKSTAKKMIIDNHYTHAWTMCNVALGIFERGINHSFFENTTDDKLIGCIVYGHPVGRQVIAGISPLVKNGEVFELTRLWIQDDTPKNTESWFIGQSFNWLKINKPLIKILVSYADPNAGHLGKIYQATNWLYQLIENTPDNDIMISMKGPPNYEWLHPRTLVSKLGFRNKKKLPRPYWYKTIRRKFRYLYILTTKVEKRKILNSLIHPIQLLPVPLNLA